MDEKWKGKERRRFPRISEHIPVTYRMLTHLSNLDFLEMEREAARTWTKDFSCGGVCIRTGKRVSPGSVLEILVDFPGHPIKAVGRVVWSRELEKSGEFFTGVEYIAVDQNQMDEMAQTVAECLVESYRSKAKAGNSKLKDMLAGLLKALKNP
ncbi:MAG: PilZ domain-containing protein [bacterium]